MKVKRAIGQQSGNLTGNVMTPLNWFVGIAETALISGLLRSHDTWIQIVMVAFIVAVLVFYGSVYVYFMLNDPDRLQTESFHLTVRLEQTLLSEPVPEKPLIKL